MCLVLQLWDEVNEISDSKMLEMKIADFNGKVSELWDTLMGLELQLVDQLEVSLVENEHCKRKILNWRFGPKGQCTSLPPSPYNTVGGGASWGWHFPWGVAHQGGVASMGGGVLSSLSHGLLQYYFVPFSKAAK